MGLFVKNTTFDDNADDELDLGSEVIIKDKDEEGIIVTKIGNLYQVKVNDKIKSFTYDELEKK